MTFKSDIESAISFLEDELGSEAFTWKGAEVPCVPNLMSRGTVLMIGGHEAEIGFTLVVRKANFLSADSSLTTVDSELVTMDNNMPHPVAGRHLVFRGKNYKILTATEDSSRAYYRLDLADKHSGK
jgi:FKBP-type peptidyl-prolyl cis-trans isomerase 2